MSTLRSAAIASLVIALTLPPAAASQIRASELGSMSQVIDGTRISITYSRPRTRGRAPLFGTRTAHWGETWTPGANWATVLDVNKDVTLNGRAVAKGKYSVWMVLREGSEWTTILEPDWHRFHEDRPDSNANQIRIPTTVDEAPFVDVLTWSIPVLRVNGGTLAMQWGTTRATMQLSVTPSLTVTMSEPDARPFVGRYTYTEESASGSNGTVMLVVTYEDSTLKAHWDPDDEYMRTFAMIRVAPDVFVPGLYDKNGEIYEVMRPDMVFTFKRRGDRPETYELRDESDALIATGKRRP